MIVMIIIVILEVIAGFLAFAFWPEVNIHKHVYVVVAKLPLVQLFSNQFIIFFFEPVYIF